MRQVRSKEGWYYYTIGSYKVAQSDVTDLIRELVGGDEQKLKDVLKRFERDEQGFVLFDKKKT